MTLDGKAALEIGRVLFPFLELGLFGSHDRIDEGVVLDHRHRAVDIGSFITCRSRFVIAGLEPGRVEIDTFAMDDRCNGVEERQFACSGSRMDRRRKLVGGQRSCRDDRQAVVRFGQPIDFTALDGDQSMRGNLGLHSLGKSVAIHSQSAAGGHLMGVGGRHDDGIAASQLFMQQADCVVFGVIRPE